jgi:hypothetical protein
VTPDAVTQGKALELNVTVWLPGIGAPFTGALPASAILPGDGNYRDHLNASIMAMTMNGVAMGAGPGRAAGRRSQVRRVSGNRSRGNRR